MITAISIVRGGFHAIEAFQSFHSILIQVAALTCLLGSALVQEKRAQDAFDRSGSDEAAGKDGGKPANWRLIQAPPDAQLRQEAHPASTPAA
jgi:hypothetical protein